MGGGVEAHWAAGREPDCIQCGGANARVALVDGCPKSGVDTTALPPRSMEPDLAEGVRDLEPCWFLIVQRRLQTGATP